jgi:hypothetical protein
MRTLILSATLVATLYALGAPALASNYPVSGKWGPEIAGKQGPIDCKGRVLGFNGDTRTDSKGGVPGYRLKSLTTEGTTFRITDEFTTGQIRNGSTSYTLRQTDADHIELHTQGGTQKLQRCKN